jgi:hypothetical protein
MFQYDNSEIRDAYNSFVIYDRLTLDQVQAAIFDEKMNSFNITIAGEKVQWNVPIIVTCVLNITTSPNINTRIRQPSFEMLRTM